MIHVINKENKEGNVKNWNQDELANPQWNKAFLNRVIQSLAK